MKLIVGLGNPGEKYRLTRHNAGYLVVDAVVAELGGFWQSEPKFKAEVAKIADIVFAKPATFMNNSGEAVASLVKFYKVALKDLTVVHDDIDLSPGAVKKCFGCGSAGHRGVEDIMAKLGDPGFFRVRVGTGRPPAGVEAEDYVLTNLSQEELDKIQSLDLDGLVRNGSGF